MTRSRFSDPSIAAHAIRQPTLGALQFHTVAQELHVRLDSPVERGGSKAWNLPLAKPVWVLRCDAGTRIATLCDDEGELHRWDDPLDALQWMSAMQGDAYQ